MEVAIKLLLGAVVGAGAGWVSGRARICSSEQCNVKANLIASLVSGAFCGAAVAWYLMHR